MGNVIVIASGKGGTGKTTFASNFGVFLAMQNKKVLLIDMDLGLRSLDLSLGLENNVVYNVMDILSGVCSIKKAMIKDKRFANLYLMAATTYRDDRDITPLHMKVLCDRLKSEFDYIIIDAPAGISELLDVAAAGADKAVIVVEADNASIRDADIVKSQLISYGIKDVSGVINKVHSELMMNGIMPNIYELTMRLNMKIVGYIQYDDNIYVSTAKGLPIVVKQDTYIYSNLKNIFERILY